MRQYRSMTRFEVHSLYQMKCLGKANRPALALAAITCLMFLALTAGAISPKFFDAAIFAVCLCSGFWLGKLQRTLDHLADSLPPTSAISLKFK